MDGGKTTGYTFQVMARGRTKANQRCCTIHDTRSDYRCFGYICSRMSGFRLGLSKDELNHALINRLSSPVAHVLHHRQTFRGCPLLDSPAHADWLDSGDNLGGVRLESVQDRQEDRRSTGTARDVNILERQANLESDPVLCVVRAVRPRHAIFLRHAGFKIQPQPWTRKKLCDSSPRVVQSKAT